MSRSIPASRLGTLVVVVLCGSARADECSKLSDPASVVRCALDRSLVVRKARQDLKAIAARRLTARVWLPNNPVAAVALTQRVVPGGAALLNWYVTLSQEIEVGGQRAARLEVADAEAAAQLRRVAVAELDSAGDALQAYYELLAAREAVRLTSAVAQVASALASFASERAKEQLMSPVDADLLAAENVRLQALVFEAERRAQAAKVVLALLLGQEPDAALEISGSLVAPSLPLLSKAEAIDRALALRGEIAAAEMQRRVLVAEVRLLRRSRIPNVTLSFEAQRDGANERVLGGGLSLPIPLPSPVGRTAAGAIAERLAMAEAAQTSVDQIRRQVRLDVERAWAADQARVAALRLYAPELITRVRADLEALREGLSTRQLSVREALISARAFIELLLGYVDSQLGAAAARVELLRSAGLPIEGGSQ